MSVKSISLVKRAWSIQRSSYRVEHVGEAPDTPPRHATVIIGENIKHVSVWKSLEKGFSAARSAICEECFAFRVSVTRTSRVYRYPFSYGKIFESKFDPLWEKRNLYREIYNPSPRDFIGNFRCYRVANIRGNCDLNFSIQMHRTSISICKSKYIREN